MINGHLLHLSGLWEINRREISLKLSVLIKVHDFMVAFLNKKKEYPSIEGVVVQGDKLGRLLGFPTANINFPNTDLITIPTGVYASKIIYQNSVYNGMVYVGVRPTFGKSELTVEVNLFDFHGELYGETLKILFIRKIREEKKFPDIESLKTQLREDKILVEKILTLGDDLNSCTK